MAYAQCDYSTLSTSITRSELGSIYSVNFGSNYADSADIIEERPELNEGDLASETETVPRDRYYLVLITFFMLGLGTVLPWNFFITAYDYWMYKFRDVHNKNLQERTSLQSTFTSYLAITSNVPLIIILILNSFIGHRVSNKVKNVGAIAFVFIAFVLITSLVKVNTDSWQTGFFALTMGTVVSTSISGAFLQAGVTSLASIFPSKCVYAMVAGQAVAGLFAALAQILSLAGHASPTSSAFSYFLCADIVLLLILLLYFISLRTEYYQYFTYQPEDSLRQMEIIYGSQSSSAVSAYVVTLKVLYEVSSVIVTFWVTLSVFPAVTVLVIPHENHSAFPSGAYFIPVSCFFIFNFGDLCGRAASVWFALEPKHSRFLLLFACLRIIFIPLFMLCNAQPRTYLPVLFTSDAYYICFVALLGLSNGYIISLGMVNGAKQVNRDFQEVAGNVLAAAAGTGLTLGAMTSYGVVKLL